MHLQLALHMLCCTCSTSTTLLIRLLVMTSARSGLIKPYMLVTQCEMNLTVKGFIGGHLPARQHATCTASGLLQACQHTIRTDQHIPCTSAAYRRRSVPHACAKHAYSSTGMHWCMCAVPSISVDLQLHCGNPQVVRATRHL